MYFHLSKRTFWKRSLTGLLSPTPIFYDTKRQSKTHAHHTETTTNGVCGPLKTIQKPEASGPPHRHSTVADNIKVNFGYGSSPSSKVAGPHSIGVIIGY